MMYEKISRYYDLLHAELREDIGFIVKQATLAGDPILELGCGTGRLLLPLARSGHEIMGLDNSVGMLDIARHHIKKERIHVRQRIKLIEGDMISFDLNKRFGTIVIGHNTMMHFTRNQVRDCLKCASSHLLPTGRLLIDVENPAIVADSSEDDLLILERKMVDPTTGDHIFQISSSWVDLPTQTRHITWMFDVSPKDGGQIKRTVVEAEFKYLFAHQYEMMFETCALKLERIFGDYESGPFGEESPRMLLVAAPR